MTTIAQMYNRFKNLNLRKQVPILIEQTRDEIIALNQRQLFNNSEDSEGEPLRFYASASYALFKEQRNSLPGYGRPDLYLTGGFYRSFVVKVSPTFYDITATDKKTGKLKAKYGEDIFGLTNDSKAEYVNQTLFKGIKAYIETQTGVAFR